METEPSCVYLCSFLIYFLIITQGAPKLSHFPAVIDFMPKAFLYLNKNTRNEREIKMSFFLSQSKQILSEWKLNLKFSKCFI